MDLYHGLVNACRSTIISIFTIASLQKIGGWLVETAGACLSAVIVAVVVWFVMRRIERRYPRPHRKDPYGDRD